MCIFAFTIIIQSDILRRSLSLSFNRHVLDITPLEYIWFSRSALFSEPLVFYELKFHLIEDDPLQMS